MEGLSQFFKDRDRALSRFGEKYGLGTKKTHVGLGEFYAQLKKLTIDLAVPVMTNFENQFIQYFEIDLYSRYQRQGHFIKDKRTFSKLYSKDFNPNSDHELLFTTNCQSAHFALLHALKACFPKASLFKPTERLYFESIYILERFENIFGSRETNEKIVFLDSTFITAEELFCFEEVDSCVAIIFDTTCFDRQSPYITDVVRKAQEKGIPLILTRSHLKLDSLGTEYGPLGSILFLNQGEELIKKTCFEYVSHMGAFATISQIYPFIFDQEIKDIASLRVQMIQENTKKIFKGIYEEKCNFGIYHPERLHGLHNVFVYDRDKVNFYKLAEKFMALSKVYNVESKFCDSFGFDFFSLTNVESCDSQNRGFLRFCSSINSNEVEGSINVIRSLVKQIEKT